MYWARFWEDERNRILREVPVHANDKNEATRLFRHDFPYISSFELISPYKRMDR